MNLESYTVQYVRQSCCLQTTNKKICPLPLVDVLYSCDEFLGFSVGVVHSVINTFETAKKTLYVNHWDVDPVHCNGFPQQGGDGADLGMCRSPQSSYCDVHIDYATR